VEYALKLANFVVYLSRIRTEHKFSQIFAADETSVWLDPAGGKCIEQKGAKEVIYYDKKYEKLKNLF
jgi:hypothetical protein